MLLKATRSVLLVSILAAGAGEAAPSVSECVIHEWAVSPGTWTGSGDGEPSLLMDSTTRWAFLLDHCSLASGVCDILGQGSQAFQDAIERVEWYPRNTEPTITAVGNTVTYDFFMQGAFVPIDGQPRFEDLHWTLAATLPSTPPDSPSAADLAGASLAVTIEHLVDSIFIQSTWSGTATETLFTSCTPIPAQLSIDDVSLAEGSGGGTTAFLFTVTRDQNNDLVSVTAETVDGSAVAGSDFTAIAPTVLTFPAGGTLTETVTVDVAADDVVELGEGFTVELSSPINATLEDGVGDGTITNDDAASLVIDDVSQDEGSGGGITPYVFTVTLDTAVDTPLSVDFDTADGTAEDESGDGDYTSAQGLLLFAGSVNETKTVTVDALADERPESDETFFVDLSNLVAGGRNVILGDATGEGVLVNDDEACAGFEMYQQPFDSPASLRGQPATIGGDVTFEDVVDAGGSITTLPAGPVSGVRVWGIGRDSGVPCALDPGVPFDLVFAADDAGVPGAVLAQSDAVLGEFAAVGSDVTRIDLLFAPVDGTGVSWISVQRDEVAGCAFEWLAEEVVSTYDDAVYIAPALAPDDTYFCVGDPVIFTDGFESGDTSAWSNTVP